MLIQALVSSGAVIVFVNEEGCRFGLSRPEITDPISALEALTVPPQPRAGQRLSSGLLPGTKVLGLRTDAETTTVEFSGEILGGELDEARLTTIFEQVKATLFQFGINGTIRLQAGNRLLSDYLAPVKRPAAGSKRTAAIMPLAAGRLTTKSIALSPGHGWIWTGSAWATQRPVYCSPLNQEDFHNLEMVQYLEIYLTQEGATTKKYRCLDKNFGTYSASGKPWWQMAACYWEKQLGYPCSVYANYSGDCTLGAGGSESNDDIRARPLASDADATDIYVSLHTNGYQGNCTNSCPTGTETYYDNSTEHAQWGAISQTLATKINSAIMSAITAYADSTWTCHGACVKDSTGNYGEIRIPDRAATLTELAFHDSCNRDADTNHLRDNFFRSAAMWGMYKGICDYFGVAPTWDFYSCELATNDIPTTMPQGSTATVHIKMVNRGVLWNTARLFRLGAVGDSDPFTATTRYTVGGEVAPGATNTFTIAFVAPATPGTYLTDWQMLRESVTPVKWFGPTLSKSVVVTDTQAPSAPTNVVATAASSTQINLSWRPSADNVGVSNYFVYRDGLFIGFTPATNYLDNSCSPSTTYSYQVSARDAAGNESARSAAAQATTPAPPDTTAPSIPGDLTATPLSPTAIVLSWSPATDDVGVSNYLVYRDSMLIGSNSATNYLDNSCSPSTTYSYQVSAIDAARNESARSLAAQATTPAPTPPVLQYSWAGGALTLSWTNGVLQQADVLRAQPGDWAEVPEASSPYSPPMTNAARFFRLRR